MLKKYFWNILISIDQLANTLCGGDPDETISSRIGKRIRNGKPNFITRALGSFLNWIDRNHCEESIEPDEGKDEVL